MPRKFQVSSLDPIQVPVYNVRDTRCGLVKVICTSEGGEIKLGGRPYEIFSKLDIDHNSSFLFIGSGPFEQLVKKNSCE
ncbi:hypothetical protein Hanom_Chr15g01387841 [Helianthus anomalus]